MKLIFAGTPEFAAQSLSAILAAGHQVALVLTQPDRPSGRGMTLRPSPVKALALASGIEVFQPLTLKDPAVQERLHAVGAEVMVVAAYGLILPQAVLDLPRYGCLNIHASLLPRWRGAAPIQRAILAGDTETGVCIMQMEAGLDTGPVLLSDRLPLASDETAGSLHDKLADLGARLIVNALEKIPLPAVPQSDTGITYAAKIEKAEALLDWRLPAAEIERKVRAFNPFPGAATVLEGVPVKIWRAVAVPGGAAPGTVLAADRHGIVVACGDGALCLGELQKAGGKRLSAAQFLSGNALSPGAVFSSTP
ncbi:methionyl-tRNA formyltransferase [Propionivibrio sp.]|jgi:methionyl-tRNA formyltransferase|uniref:methionyl-tRNA formyltransferase n=1 Tax=Propionivibrio sp. TaxID=2212460 RepID=UPI00272E3FC5|nr:methionyl-tRNA formyltransferase [Propionivibrio sp.]